MSYAAVQLLQSFPTLCNPMDCSLPDSSVHGILQARILEWVAISFCRRSSQPRDQTHVPCICRWIFFFFFTAAPLGKTLSQKWPYFLKICLNQVRPTHCYLLIYIYIYIYTLSLLSSLFSSQFTCWGNWIICPLKFAILHFAGGTEVYFSKSDLSLTITNILN